MNIKHKNSFDINNPPKCAFSECNNTVEKIDGEWKWKKYCCKLCGNKGGRERKKATFSKNFGNSDSLTALNEKRRKACLEKYGVDNPQKSLAIQQKTRETNIERYGVQYVSSNKIIREKQKSTCLERYGVEYPLQSQEILEKTKQTNLSRYGVEWTSQNLVIREKQKSTCLERYGVEYSFQSQEILEKIKQTNLSRYGVDNPTKNPEILEKALTSGKCVREAVLPSGKTVKLRGYEPKALNELLTLYQEDQIITNLKLMPKITYVDGAKERQYFPDFYIPSVNLIVEVKSEYTLKVNERINLLKKDACLDLGHNFMFMVVYPNNSTKIIQYDAKGRCCRYEVIGELGADQVPADAFTQPVQDDANYDMGCDYCSND